jgi:hypothetical protein
VPRLRYRNWRIASLVTLVGAAAAVLLALTLPDRPPGNRSNNEESVEPFELVAAGDVEIISVRGDDLGALVMDDLPFQDPVVLVSAEDVDLDNIAPDEDGMVPFVQVNEDSTTPMIVAPLGAGQVRGP